MKTKLLLVGLLSLVVFIGCNHRGGASNRTVKRFVDGKLATVTSYTKILSPSASKGVSSFSVSTNGVFANLSAVQNVADIEEAKQSGKSKQIMYIACGLLLVLGGVAFAAPDYIISNQDALLLFASGGVGFAFVRFVEESMPIVKYALPLAVLGGGAYLVWKWKRTKQIDIDINKV